VAWDSEDLKPQTFTDASTSPALVHRTDDRFHCAFALPPPTSPQPWAAHQCLCLVSCNRCRRCRTAALLLRLSCFTSGFLPRPSDMEAACNQAIHSIPTEHCRRVSMQVSRLPARCLALLPLRHSQGAGSQLRVLQFRSLLAPWHHHVAQLAELFGKALHVRSQIGHHATLRHASHRLAISADVVRSW